MAVPMVLGMKSPTLDTAANKKSYDADEKIKPMITSERLAQLRKMVDEAIKEHRIFTIRGGWQTLRRAFLKRNWIEKLESPKQTKPSITSSNSTDDLTSNLPTRQEWESPAAHIAKCERTIMSRLLQMYDVDFYWNCRRDQHDVTLRMNCHKLMNRFSRSLFTSKEGLCLLLQQMHWHNEVGVASVNFPRCYVLGFPDHYNNFVEDFRLTACMALLKFAIHKYDAREEIGSIEGTVEVAVLQFAIDRLNEFLAVKKHLDIDVDIPQHADDEWNRFIEDCRKVLHENKVFFERRDEGLAKMIAGSKTIIKNLHQYCPQMDLDGMKNIWIMKPGNKCRGRGIQLIKEVKDVTKIMDLKLKYVVQKYIEKPLIIYNTKFDIRQWFLVTGTQPLQIWMYRESYLRFSSQKFSLENFHESLHLTNHAVQCKYKNNTDRDKALPQDNMWDCNKFKEYLKQIGQGNKWDVVIFPGMKECIVGAMLACQETMDRRPNTFELYGADFILAEDFRPWLLEINSSPDLSSSTSVTSRMCPQCLEDIVKVVIDKRQDANSDTGLFELVYKQNLPRAPAYLGMSLSVRGHRMFKRHKSKKDKENEMKKSNSGMRIKLVAPERNGKQETDSIALTRKYSGPVIADLMAELQKKMVDSDDGVEVASPVKVARKKPQKCDARVAKVSSRRLKVNKNRSSIRRSNGEGNSSRATRTAPLPKQREESWVYSNPEAELNDVWRKGTVSILKGKHVLEKFNKSSTLSTPKDMPSKSILKQPIYFGPPRDKNLLTVGYRFGLPHLNRPNT